jgi:hypothetical protein
MLHCVISLVVTAVSTKGTPQAMENRCWKNLTGSLQSFKDQCGDGKQILTFKSGSEKNRRAK